MQTSADEHEPIPYQRNEPGISRRAFRMLLILTTINTLLLGMYVLGPGLTSFVRQQYDAYREKVAKKQLLAQAQAARAKIFGPQQQCMDYAVAPGTLVYAEDREGIAGLGNAEQVHQLVANDRLRNIKWTGKPIPSAAALPACAQAMPPQVLGFGVLFSNSNMGIVFMHERRATPTSPARLIVVFLTAEQSSPSVGGAVTNYALFTLRKIVAVTVRPATKDEDPGCEQWSALYLKPREQPEDYTLISEKRASGPVPSYTIEESGQLQLFAGQPDPADPSRFTIPYRYNGEMREIVGVLGADGQVKLTPEGIIAPLRTSTASLSDVSCPPPSRRVAKGIPTTQP